MAATGTPPEPSSEPLLLPPPPAPVLPLHTEVLAGGSRPCVHVGSSPLQTVKDAPSGAWAHSPVLPGWRSSRASACMPAQPGGMLPVRLLPSSTLRGREEERGFVVAVHQMSGMGSLLHTEGRRARLLQCTRTLPVEKDGVCCKRGSECTEQERHP